MSATNSVAAARARLQANAQANDKPVTGTDEVKDPVVSAGATESTGSNINAQGSDVVTAPKTLVPPPDKDSEPQPVPQVAGYAPTANSNDVMQGLFGEGVQTQEAVLIPELSTSNMREFRHAFAGANTIMPDGKKLEFPGRPGGQGVYLTDKPREIDFLEELTEMPGSQITEVVRDSQGREIGAGVASRLKADWAAAVQDATANTRRDLNPNIIAARSNLGNSIAQNS